ncbi:hypothetical protein LXL04_001664 [Taraxacum kok-saghyz]
MLKENYGDVCFFKAKRSVVCGSHLQPSAAEEVDQMSAVCNKKTGFNYQRKVKMTLQHQQAQKPASKIEAKSKLGGAEQAKSELGGAEQAIAVVSNGVDR